jgi:3',5'-cyclic-AMP phosphodiesterase
VTVPHLEIAHISDLHAGSPYFVPSLMDRVVVELNELRPDLVLCTGDLTEMGLRQDYVLATEYLQRIECPRVVVIPGNHDARNVGYVHFEELVGPRSQTLHLDQVTIVALDSSEPDLDYGHIGRARYDWLREQFAPPTSFRILMLHHHLLPVPGTGRERNIVYDAGDVLEVLQDCGVDLVLSGHKHVPYAWRLERLFVVNAGTCSSQRLRGHTKACYNVVRLEDDRVEVVRKYPFHGTETLIEFVPSTASFEKYVCPIPRQEEGP